MRSLTARYDRRGRQARPRRVGHQHAHHVVAITDASSLAREPVITAVALAELSVGSLVASTGAEREARQAPSASGGRLRSLAVDAQAARAFGLVAALLRRAGGKVNARAYDAMIAAIALANRLVLSTPAILATSSTSKVSKWSVFAALSALATKGRTHEAVEGWCNTPFEQV